MVPPFLNLIISEDAHKPLHSLLKNPELLATTHPIKNVGRRHRSSQLRGFRERPWHPSRCIRPPAAAAPEALPEAFGGYFRRRKLFSGGARRGRQAEEACADDGLYRAKLRCIPRRSRLDFSPFRRL